MIKLIGIVMIIGSCSAIGVFTNAELRKKIQLVSAFIEALHIIRTEVIFRAMPVCQLLETLSKQGKPYSDFFKTVLMQMRRDNSVFQIALLRHRTELEDMKMDKSDSDIVFSALLSVGKYDCETQKAVIDKSIAELEQSLERLTQVKMQKAKLVQAVSFSIGLVIALIII